MIIPKYFSESVLVFADEIERVLDPLQSETKKTSIQLMGAHTLLRKAVEADVETLLETLTKISLAIFQDLSNSGSPQKQLYSLMVKTGKLIDTCAKFKMNQPQVKEEVPDFYQTCLALENPLSPLTRKVKCEMFLRSEENPNTWVPAAERVVLLAKVRLKNELQFKVRNLSKKHLYVSLYFFSVGKKITRLHGDYSYLKKESEEIKPGKALTVSRVFHLPEIFTKAKENLEFEANIKIFITEFPHNFEWVVKDSNLPSQHDTLLETAAWAAQNHSFYLQNYRISVTTPEDLSPDKRKEILCHWSNYHLVTTEIRQIFLEDLRKRLQWDLVDRPYFFIASNEITGSALKDGYYTGEIHIKRDELQPSVKIGFKECLETGHFEVSHDLNEDQWKALDPSDLLKFQASLNAFEGQKGLVATRSIGIESTGFFRGEHNTTKFIKTLKSLGGRSILKLEKRMRPNRDSNAGFLGQDDHLLDVMAADNDTVRNQGLTHALLAEPLYYMEAMMEREPRLSNSCIFIYHHCVYKVHKIQWRGCQNSPLPLCEVEAVGSRDYRIQNCETGEKIDVSDLLTRLISDYGFYEGNTRYRIDPGTLINFFKIKNVGN